MPKGSRGFQKGHIINLGKHWKLSQKTKKKMSLAKIGLRHSLKTRIKMSKSQIGKHGGSKPWTTGQNNYFWKGENASYGAKHKWLVIHFGKADKCENPNCVFLNPKRFEWANINGKYKRKRNDYIMLCASCHRTWDLNKIKINAKAIIKKYKI